MNNLIYKSGYLYKRSSSSSSSDNKSRWQKRWFETIDTSTSYCLTYYKTSKKEKLLGVLYLSKIKEIQQADSTVDYDDDEDNDRLQLQQKATLAAATTACSFNIILDNNNKYTMKATSIHDVNDWIRILNRLKSAPVSADG
jgi:hypothetical protein